MGPILRPRCCLLSSDFQRHAYRNPLGLPPVSLSQFFYMRRDLRNRDSVKAKPGQETLVKATRVLSEAVRSASATPITPQCCLHPAPLYGGIIG